MFLLLQLVKSEIFLILHLTFLNTVLFKLDYLNGRHVNAI